MDFGSADGGGADVIVGPSREVAARVFGDVIDNALVTSYVAFDTDVDLAATATVSVVAAPGLDRLLDRLEIEAASLWPKRVRLGLPTGREGHDALEAAFARRPNIAVSGLASSERGLIVTLDHAADVTPAEHARLLARVRAEEPQSAPGTSALAMPFLRRSVTLGIAALALGVVTALALIWRSPLGTDGVVVALLIAVLVGQGMAMVAIAYVVRLARTSRAEAQQHGRLLTTRTDGLIKLARTGAKQEAAMLQEVARLEQEILALGRLVSRFRVEARSFSDLEDRRR